MANISLSLSKFKENFREKKPLNFCSYSGCLKRVKFSEPEKIRGRAFAFAKPFLAGKKKVTIYQELKLAGACFPREQGTK